ncbi:MAG: four helix bundle protein [Bacteroidetes bacterium]|nr:four helix bundle protein [Bacteroidota bacterium]
MENQEEENFNKSMRERTMKMAINIHGLFQSKKIIQINRPMIHQLIRSSSSVAANCRAATRARSDAEFYAKICIVVEECDETQFWCDYLIRIGILSALETIELRDEVDQLTKIFTTIKKKMKDRTKVKGQI